LAIAVDNLASAQEMTAQEEEENERKAEEERIRREVKKQTFSLAV
jgi:hypothetical protein